MDGYRKELKYIVDDGILIDVGNRLSGIMRIDEHQQDEYYNIRSIYFDDPNLSCLYENEAGIMTREKYRIRVYNHSDEKIGAEVKIRHNDTISKIKEDISRQTFEALMGNDSVKAANLLMTEKPGSRVLEKFACRIAGKMFRPQVIVDYERCAFVYDTCNVRITFDRNITASTCFDRFFDSSLPGIPALDNNMHVLEIKYDEFLPDEILSLLSGVLLQRESCSKYARCMYRVMQ